MNLARMQTRGEGVQNSEKLCRRHLSIALDIRLCSMNAVQLMETCDIIAPMGLHKRAVMIVISQCHLKCVVQHSDLALT